MKRSIISTLVALSFAAAAVPLAVAQSATPSAAPQRPAHSQSAFKPSERAEARLAYVKTALKITDAQAPQWNAYANVVRKQAQQADQRMQERRARMAAQGAERKRPTAIERLERRQQFLTTAAARSSERLAVQKPLYAALSPEQQRVADEVFAPRGNRGQRGGHHGGGGKHGRA